MDPDAVRRSINQQFNKLYTTTTESDGTYVMKPNICAVCDEFILLNEICILSLNKLKECHALLGKKAGLTYNNGSRDYYFDGNQYDPTVPWNRMFLSKGTQVKRTGTGRNGIMCCTRCKNALDRHVMPKMAIANGFLFGQPPECLLRLTEVERAFLTPVKTYGYCFSYTGGFQKELKGSLSYYKVQISSIVRASAHFETLGMSDNIVILLYGNMTPDQKRKAMSKRQMRTSHIMEAITWLCANNSEWIKADVDITSMCERLRNPTVIDNSVEVQGAQNNNIEKKESIQIFFPDTNIDVCTGGQETMDEFKQLVKQAQESGYSFELQADLIRESVYDYKDNNLVNSCLIQFPYGSGGLHEKRLLNNESIGVMDIETYVSHISRISRPHFNEELFVLIIYNMRVKMKMVKGASFRVRNEASAALLATELQAEDIDIAINNRRNGTLSGGAGDQFLKSIDAVGRGVGHTNEAARKARRTAECLQHHFGMPTHFLTVTPDDDNNILVQIYSQNDVDINAPNVDNMESSEVEHRARKRTETRIKYPGIAAAVFEDMLNIVINVAIGWDSKEKKGKPGLFGTPDAFTASIEEQGRRTLHVHFQIWIREILLSRDNLFSTNRFQRRAAEEHIIAEADRTMGADFFFNKDDVSPGHIMHFKHDCTLEPNRRRHPVVVGDQQIRELRYKQGHSVTGITFATCPHCTKTWNYTEFVKEYILSNVKDAGYVACEGEGDFMLRMKAKTIDYQKRNNVDKIPSYIIEAGYNLHKHTYSCWKKALDSDKAMMTAEEKQASRKRMLQCECRYRLPVRKKARTCVDDACEEKVRWYFWNGVFVERNIKELNLRRNVYDLFQNQSCPAIGESKMSCNTNINMIFHGSTGQYAMKYCMKENQQDENKVFEAVTEHKDRILSVLPHPNGERSEATRRLLVASYAHQKSNVVGAPMSAYLTRHDERFVFSHPTVWVPLQDLKTLLDRNSASSSAIIYHGNTPFFLCVALHYLARPVELEETCVFDFFAHYEVIRVTGKNSADLYRLHNTDHFTHPSYRQSSGNFLQGVRERHERHLPKVRQYDFPDTADFGGNILSSDVINEAMETYAELALLLFFPFRSKQDLVIGGSFVKKLRASATIIETRQSFLNNIQDSKANCFRIVRMKDDLERHTKPVEATDDADRFVEWERADHIEEEYHEMQGVTLDSFLEDLQRADIANFEDDSNPTALHVEHMKNKGRKNCGFKNLCRLRIPSSTQECHDVTTAAGTNAHNIDPAVRNALTEISPVREKITKGDIVRVIMHRTNRITRSFHEITGCSDDIVVLEANGTVKSIFDWATKAELDRHQRRAFEVILGHFLLTFITQALSEEGDNNSRDRRRFNDHKASIYKLLEKDRQNSPQTICMLYGPGGSGKTTVIDLVLEYAREYCSFHETVEFTSRTIVVSAMTGVAATMLRGETTHAAVYLNQKSPITAEQIEIWTNTRLLIVDEISFASRKIFIDLDKKLRKLKCTPDTAYGGLSVVFSGDFRQLEPVGKGQHPIYNDPCSQFTDWVDCYLELEGMHRFKDDPEWGTLLRRFRDGDATESDIKTINTRVVSQSEELPCNLRYATYFNRDRDAINAALFERRCQDLRDAGLPLHDSVLILSDDHQVRNGAKVYTKFLNPKKLWTECGEDDVKPNKRQSRMDPVLRLYHGCRVMLPSNQDVRNGLANGTQASVVKVNLAAGVQPFQVEINDTCSVQAVFASQVESVELQHLNERITPATFSIRPKEHFFKLHIAKPHMMQTKRNKKEYLQMKATQLPLLVNNATTGHKLQGCGVPALFVHGWSLVKNWAYVMLSRVRTMEGLYLREKLDPDLSHYKMSPNLKSLITRLKSNFSPTMWSDEEYTDLFGI